MDTHIEQVYRHPGLSVGIVASKVKLLKQVSQLVSGLRTELCYNVEVKGNLSEEDRRALFWILGNPLHPGQLSSSPHLVGHPHGSLLIEIGPRLNFSTAFSSNAVSICQKVGLTKVTRVEVSVRYLVDWEQNGLNFGKDLETKLAAVLHDKMTECRYDKPLESFNLGVSPAPWFEVDVMGKGREALEEVNSKLGLAFDNWDLDFYTNLFKDKLKRNPTSVECFDLAQSNSEHSRHWFFKGSMVIDGERQKESLFDMIIQTQANSNPNNVIKFSDNSSAIEGFEVQNFRPHNPQQPSSFKTTKSMSHLIFTAETHNFPTGVAPFSGATTGTGGRLRDVHAVGRGGHCIAGTAGYSVGNLLIQGYDLPWEEKSFKYPSNFALPVDILVEASNGASDYGNKFGEPVVCGFTRSFGLLDSSGERREWIKPIMFSGGVGSIDFNMTEKLKPAKGMQIVKMGGPVYRIGVGGGAASSVEVQGDNTEDLDFGAVQRGDAEMEQKLNRVIRACLELGENNPILTIHDQGAGGNGNVLKELVEPEGAVIFTKRFQLGDPTISTLELWGAEYQENDALLCKKEDVPLLASIGQRERCPINFVGTVTGTGKVILSEEDDMNDEKYLNGSVDGSKRHPVDLELELVLGKMPQKEFRFDRKPLITRSLSLPASLTVGSALERVLRLPTVCSKRFLTNKVDRCVTGLIAQQQCVGPLHTPLADVAVTALSIFNTEGIATAIGEQPIKGLIDAKAGARMAVAESLTNLVFAAISDIKDVKCSGNWMWAAKLPGEGSALYEACQAMCIAMSELGIAIDGGKDSLSMAARVGTDTVKAPGTLVVSTYAPCPDIRVKITPDLKSPSLGQKGCLVLVDLSSGKMRLGGSALAQCFKQLGDCPPDLDDSKLLSRAFNATQKLLKDNALLAGHDVSDGGLVTCLLEMAFAGLSGLLINIDHTEDGADPLEVLFAEELGWVLEVSQENLSYVRQTFRDAQVPCHCIGYSTGLGAESKIQMKIKGSVALNGDVISLFRLWEETSYRLECRQTNVQCARQEFEGLRRRLIPKYHLSFNANVVPKPSKTLTSAPRVAVIREEGTNGDREMSASLFMAGFEVWDVTMQDLLDEKITVDGFRGIVFPGGFSYADVLGSAKGWAANLLFHSKLRDQFKAFALKQNTFSLGVCNGCQLMSLLGWIGIKPIGDAGDTPDIVLDHNDSERFECRFSTVRIESSKAMMLQGMSDSVLGVWVAHGEGNFTMRESSILKKLESGSCVALRYVNEDGQPTMEYPLNPNGSIGSIAGICSTDGRHLAMMPHPERCTKMWQWPWAPAAWSSDLQVSPWMRMFHNAFTWCVDNSQL
ncbi:phosphoribosylformylglycinamidine synthase [Frankliniella occidentalis]|uniref:Phosphoribosylformylglycinamidine synthase n=1 Tax=Frankliniella occidentalis TaxID=133901 RepID=A0A6J1RZ23_FRAOC|nr:phosphoribosylformylglycinamidine synthase [Frankliniella occidentalis]XP_026272195.1 phosphoribosylformylglycinamidine synthase [Frankliniella occidentalis]